MSIASTRRFSLLSFYLILVDNGRSCQEPKCELRIANYSRHGPTVIECVADNEKSPRKSKIFNVDVMCMFYRTTVLCFLY